MLRIRNETNRRDKSMNLIELKDFLERNSGTILWMQPEDDLGAIYLKSEEFNEIIRIDLDKLKDITEGEIKLMLAHGKNIEQMTRVTGYFSLIKKWNAGKKAELKDRYRVKEVNQ